jgi:pimeloyl-ACP methyl ester carboxylesterase
MSSYYALHLNTVKTRYLAAADNLRIGYSLFKSESKPLANIILLQSGIKVLLGYVLSQKYDLAVYNVDIRGLDNNSDVSFKEAVWMDIKTVVRHVKNNNPDIPIFLGGHGFGASVALNYAFWKLKEPVNGYIFVSPIVDIRSSLPSDQQVMRVESLRKMYNIPTSKSWFSNRPNSPCVQHLSVSNDVFWSPMSFGLWEAIISKNMIKQFKELDAPFGLWIGADDELVRAEKLVSLVSETNKICMKNLQVIPFSSHMGALITCTAFIIPWLKRFVKIIAPTLSFRLRSSRLENFEKLQFIGKGSFGRVYLVRHIASNQYFAMKVLNKADIFEAKETRHVISEKNILRQMNSAFIVSYVCSFQDDRHLYLIMEYVAGGELFTQLSLKKRFSNDVAKFYAAEILL